MITPAHLETDPLITAITTEIEIFRNQRREHYKTQSHPLGKRFSQEELSDYAYPSYKNLLIGRTRRLPDRATLLRIAEYLECSFEERQKLLHAAQYAPEAPRSQQRKQVTILIADLSLSPALLALEDVEESTELLQTLWLRYDALIMAGRGIVVKRVATRLIAVWSAETTREDDPTQAVRAALRLREATAMVAQERGLALILRVGLHTGMALLGAQGHANIFEVSGQGVNIATSLQEQAGEGITLSQATYDHVQDQFVVEQVPPQRHTRLPTPTYRVLDRRRRTFRFHEGGDAAPLVSLIGRDAECARLQTVLHEVMAQPALAVITIIGEAGIGKSRLISEFADWVQEAHPNFTLFHARAGQSSHEMVNILLCELFVNRFRIMDDETESDILRKFEIGFIEALGDTTETRQKAKLLMYYLGYATLADETTRYQEDPRLLRGRVLHILTDYFEALSDQLPTLILLEDIHWSDSSSCEFLAHLFRMLANQTIMVICTARPSLFERHPDWGKGAAFYQRLTLESLSSADSDTLVENLLPKMETIPPELRTVVNARAEGNPYFIEELIKMLIDKGIVDTSTTAWQLVAPPDGDSLPATLISLLQVRFDLLPEAERRLLQAASVMGRNFWDVPLQTLTTAPKGRTAVAQRQMTALLEGLVERGLLIRPTESTFRNVREYQFRHGLMRDAIYETILKRERQAYHHSAGDWLSSAIEEGIFSDEYGSLVALHYKQAGQFENAVRWFQRTGAYAVARYANTVALDLFTQALDLASAYPALYPLRVPIWLQRARLYRLGGQNDVWKHDLDALSADVSGAQTLSTRSQMMLLWAEYHHHVGNTPESAAYAQYAMDLAHKGGIQTDELEACFWVASIKARAGDLMSAREMMLTALPIAQSARLDDARIKVFHRLGAFNLQLGLYEEARTALQQALRFAERHHDRAGQAAALVEMGGLELCINQVNKARKVVMQALEIQMVIGDIVGMTTSLLLLGFAAAQGGNYKTAQEYYQRAWDQATRLEDAHLMMQLTIASAGSRLAMGHTEEALHDYDSALKIADTLQNQSVLPAILDGLAQTYYETQQCEDAIAHAERGIAITDRMHSLPLLVNSLINLGRSLFVVGRLDEAAQVWLRVLALEQTLGSTSGMLYAQLKLAQTALHQQDQAACAHWGDQAHALMKRVSEDEFAFKFDYFLTAHEVLAALDDPHAPMILKRGYAQFQQVAAQVKHDHPEAILSAHHFTYRQLLTAWSNTRRDNSEEIA